MLGTFTNFAKDSSSISKLASFIDQLVVLSSCLGTAASPRDLPSSHTSYSPLVCSTDGLCNDFFRAALTYLFLLIIQHQIEELRKHFFTETVLLLL